MKAKVFKTSEAVAMDSGAMEFRDHFKNGASSKGLMSRGKFRSCALTLIGLMFFSLAFAQPDFRKAPKDNERVIGTVTDAWGANTNEQEVYRILLEKAKKEFPNKVIDLRNVEYKTTRTWDPGFKCPRDSKGRKLRSGCEDIPGWYDYFTNASSAIVEFVSPETMMNETIVKAIDKAMISVRAGSRLAVDQISASGGLSKETVNDQLLDILLDKGYRVVAKEYLEKLKTEQEEQQSGGFNEKTTVKTDNFSGVGYFLNVRVNEKSIRIQVINVSTGEYEGNATVDF